MVERLSWEATAPTKEPNDKTYQSNRFSADSLPPKVDLRPYMTTVENQGNSNSCTANAMAGAYEYLANRLRGTSDDVSRLFIYYNARDLDGDPDKDEGTYLRSCIKVLKSTEPVQKKPGRLICTAFLKCPTMTRTTKHLTF